MPEAPAHRFQKALLQFDLGASGLGELSHQATVLLGHVAVLEAAVRLDRGEDVVDLLLGVVLRDRGLAEFCTRILGSLRPGGFSRTSAIPIGLPIRV